jgi:hypothetical protein
LRLSGFPTPAMSFLRSSGSAHLARMAAAIRSRRSGLLIAAMNLLRSSGLAQRALVSALFRSRAAGSAQYSCVAVRCFSFTLSHRIVVWRECLVLALGYSSDEVVNNEHDDSADQRTNMLHR